MINQNNQLQKLWFSQATEGLCHLSVTDIKKPFCNIWFFCKNEACANCTDWKATIVIWLLTGFGFAVHIYIIFELNQPPNTNSNLLKIFKFQLQIVFCPIVSQLLLLGAHMISCYRLTTQYLRKQILKSSLFFPLGSEKLWPEWPLSFLPAKRYHSSA